MSTSTLTRPTPALMPARRPFAPVPCTWRLTYHAHRQAIAKGFTAADVLLAASDPSITYLSSVNDSQHRHIRNGIVAVCDRETMSVITVYANVKVTELRPDQRAAMAHAERFAK